MIIKQILIDKIKKNEISSFECELLLAHVLKKSREYILSHPEEKLTKLQIKNYELRIKERLNNVPLAYITGEKEFYGFNFKVNKNVLVPRPETELMVEEAVNHITRNPQPATIIDVGTGSGCIIISLAKLIKNYLSSVALAKGDELKITNYELIGVDISKKSLSVAKQNAKLYKIYDKIKFINGNLLESIIKNKKFLIRNSKFLILANLPYLTPRQIKNSPSIKHEPKLALTAGLDGLKYYRQLFKQIKIWLNKTAAESSRRDSAGAEKMLCVSCYVLCEIDPTQKNTIKRLIKKELPEADFEIKKDLKGHSRLAIISI